MTDTQTPDLDLAEYSFEVLEQLPTEAALLTRDLRIVYMNNMMREVVGTENLGKKCYKVYQENLDKCKECPLREPIPNGDTVWAVCEGALGDRVIKFMHKALEIDGTEYVLEVWDDITEQREAQQQLTWLASFAEKNPTPILEWDEKLNLTYQNPAAE